MKCSCKKVRRGLKVLQKAGRLITGRVFVERLGDSAMIPVPAYRVKEEENVS